MVRNLTFVDTITLAVLHGGEILAGIMVRVKYPLVQVPPGWGARSKGRVGVGMVVDEWCASAMRCRPCCPESRTSTGCVVCCVWTSPPAAPDTRRH